MPSVRAGFMYNTRAMITDIRLQNFRSYEDGSFEFDSGVNIIVGPNASGKTSLLEAILMISLGRSYRAKDAEALRHDAPWLRLDVHTQDGSRSLKLVPAGTTLAKTFVLNDVTVRRLSLQKQLPVVLFEPNHLYLLHGQPDGRRDYLDGLLEQLRPGYASLRRQYRRTLAQRNRLLKQPHNVTEQIFVWSIRLGELGGQIAAERQWLVGRIADRLPQLYGELSRTDKVISVAYTSGCDVAQYSSDMVYRLEQSLERDLERGFTSYGPHRDDMSVWVDGHLAQEAASRGEIRTLVLGLKIIELELLQEYRNQPPLLLLDDVFSELDGARREALTNELQSHQTFITTTDADIIIKNFSQHSNLIAL